MTQIATRGAKTVTEDDVGKEVVTCFGRPIGTVGSVTGSNAVYLAPAPDCVSYLESIGLNRPATPSIRLRPEEIEMVTAERIWLRL